MEIDIFSLLSAVYKSFVSSGFFRFIKIFAGIIIAILLIADILLLAKRIRGDVKVAFYGAKVPGLKKSKYTKDWERIKRHLEEKNISRAKVAVIEADRMLSETLEKIGYQGRDVGEKIAAVRPGQLIGLEEAAKSHEVFKKIVKNPELEISVDELRESVAGYEKVFRGLELLD